MSGPKGVRYRVVSQAELDRRACVEAQRRCAQLASRIARVSGELRALGHGELADAAADPGREPGASDVRGWRTRESTLSATAKELDAHLATAQRAAATAAIHERLARLDLGIDLHLGAGTTAPRSRADASEQGAEDELASSVARAVGLIAQISRPEVRDELAARAEAILTADDTQARLGRLLTLQSDVQATIRAQRTAELVDQRRDEVLLALAALPEEQVADLRGPLERASTRAEVDRVADQVAELAARDIAEQDRRFVLDQVQEALTELGYTVDQVVPAGEDTGSPDGETWVATSPKVGGRHGLQVRFLPGDDRFFTNVVALDDTTATQDLAAEEVTCHDLSTLLGRLEGEGIDTDLFHAKPAGAVPVEQASTAPRRRRRRRAQARERGRS